MKNRLPDSIVNRSDKMGFPTPFAHWLKGPLKNYILDTFASKAFKQRGLFHPEKVVKLLEIHCQSQTDCSWILWRILILQRDMIKSPVVYMRGFH
jgi:asparagine synthase (glutamine-hydrolysing)